MIKVCWNSREPITHTSTRWTITTFRICQRIKVFEIVVVIVIVVVVVVLVVGHKWPLISRGKKFHSSSCSKILRRFRLRFVSFVSLPFFARETPEGARCCKDGKVWLETCAIIQIVCGGSVEKNVYDSFSGLVALCVRASNFQDHKGVSPSGYAILRIGRCVRQPTGFRNGIIIIPILYFKILSSGHNNPLAITSKADFIRLIQYQWTTCRPVLNSRITETPSPWVDCFLFNLFHITEHQINSENIRTMDRSGKVHR